MLIKKKDQKEVHTLYYTQFAKYDLYGTGDMFLLKIAKTLKHQNYITSSFMVVKALLFLIKERYFEPDEVEIIFIDKNGIRHNLIINDEGKIEKYPDTFYRPMEFLL